MTTGQNFDLSGQVIVITGAGHGLGRAYARYLAGAGALVAVADVDGDRGSSVAAEVSSAGGTAVAYQVDVTDAAAVGRMTDSVAAQWGRLDGLVNNAGIYPFIPWEEVSGPEWDRVYTVNVTGAFLCARAAVQHMAPRGRGKIVNVASGLVWRPMARRNPHYVAAKGAIVAMTRALAREWGDKNICVNAISPGLVQGEDLIQHPTEFVDAMVADQCLPRVERPADLCGAIHYLLAPASDFVTGQTLAVDGGWTMA
jgi:NAD(P)-dependent dehydrogenase (short-subunit alcohol dehydrogenase family)